MNNKPHQYTRRKFLLHLSALTPMAAFFAFRGRFFGDLALTQSATPAATAASFALDCIASPEMTEGPYFVDELLNRSDIRSDPTNNTVRPGIPLELTIGVFNVMGNTCAPLQNAFIDIWHCDAAGLYSDEQANNTVGQKFLRGYQVTDANGLVKFTTIYPGWYMGRTVHIHSKVRLFSSAATPSAATLTATPDVNTKSYEFNTQVFFDDTLSDTVYTQPPYNKRGKRDTTNATDNIFNASIIPSNGITPDAHDAGELMLVNITKQRDTYMGRVNVGVDLTKPSAMPQGGPGGNFPPGGPSGPGMPIPPSTANAGS